MPSSFSATLADGAAASDALAQTGKFTRTLSDGAAASDAMGSALVSITLGSVPSPRIARGLIVSPEGGAPPGPQPPPPGPWTSRVASQSYDRWGNILGLLPDSSGRTWQEQLNATGTGSTTIDLLAPDGSVNPERATVPYRAILRFFLDGNAKYQTLIENKKTTAIASGEESVEQVVIGGRGSIAIFEEALVYPYNGLGWYPFSDKRVFDFSSPEVDEVSWPNAVEIKQQDNPFNPYGGAPTNWPDHAAKWIWGVGGPGPYPVGFCYFKKRMYLSNETNVRFFISADDGFELRVDGASAAAAAQAAEQRDFIWSKTTTVDLWLSPGVHTIAIRGENVARPGSPTTNVAAVIFSCYAISATGQLLPAPAIPLGPIQPIMASDNTWKCLAYPTTPPGLPIGSTFHFLFNEAKARGCFGVAETGVPYADLGFSGTLDSAGNPWPVVEFGFQVGSNLLSTILEMADTYVDFRMRAEPGIGIGGMPASMILDAYNTIGTTPGVTLAAGVNLGSLGYDGKV